MTSELVVGVVFGHPVVSKTTLSYSCLPFHSPTQASQLTGTSSYYWFRCHYPLITYLTSSYIIFCQYTAVLEVSLAYNSICCSEISWRFPTFWFPLSLHFWNRILENVLHYDLNATSEISLHYCKFVNVLTIKAF